MWDVSLYHVGVGVRLQISQTGKTVNKGPPQPSNNRAAQQCPGTGGGRCWEEGSRSGQVTL